MGKLQCRPTSTDCHATNPDPPEILRVVEIPGRGVTDNVTVCWFLHDGSGPEGVWHWLEAQRFEEILCRLEHLLHGITLQTTTKKLYYQGSSLATRLARYYPLPHLEKSAKTA